MTKAIAYIDANRMVQCLNAGIQRLFQRREYIDQLNVFPVPDRDTGTNMAFSFKVIQEAVHNANNLSIKPLMVKIAEASLDGSRGNSGAIMAQYFHGFSESLGNRNDMNAADLATASSAGAVAAWTAMSEPVAGALPTVLEDFSAALLQQSRQGVHDIHKMLLEPKEEFHCMNLMGSNLQDNVNVKVIDATAKLNYQERIRELQSEIEDAEVMNNSTLLLSLREEYDFLLEHISSSMGLAGKVRKVGSSVEKARSAITWRIRSAVKKINKSHPDLADHLSRSIKTGTYCSYKPEVNIHWKLS